MPRRSPRMQQGDVVRAKELVSVTGHRVLLPDPESAVHLQFRRFAGCPLCNLHLQSVLRRYDEILARGIREVVVFHSPAVELRDHVAHLPFPVVADPGQKLYAEFGVGSAPRALLTPAVWPPMLRAILRSSAFILRGRELPPRFPPEGGRLGLPADFLITVDGHIAAAKYGEHAYDQWSVDDLLRYAGDLLNRETGASGHDWRDREEAAPQRADRSFRRR
jgi:peroxiredoxin